jgi:hypothetical protein
MGKEISDANQQANYANCQAELKLALERALQIEVWEKIALARLHDANIKGSEYQAAHHQTHLRLIQSLKDYEAIHSHLQAIIQARDRDIFWRLANPLRKFVGILPWPIAKYSRKTFKLLYWVVTPWKMKHRLQYLKNRNNLQVQQANNSMHIMKNVLDSDHEANAKDIVLNPSARDLYEKIQKNMTGPRAL